MSSDSPSSIFAPDDCHDIQDDANENVHAPIPLAILPERTRNSIMRTTGTNMNGYAEQREPSTILPSVKSRLNKQRSLSIAFFSLLFSAVIVPLLSAYEAHTILRLPLAVLSTVTSVALFVSILQALGQVRRILFTGVHTERVTWLPRSYVIAVSWSSEIVLRTYLLVVSLSLSLLMIVDYPEYWQLQEGNGYLPRAIRVSDGFSFDNETFPMPFGKGVKTEIPLACPTSKCTWPEHETLGVCNNCIDASDLLNFSCHDLDVYNNSNSSGAQLLERLERCTAAVHDGYTPFPHSRSPLSEAWIVGMDGGTEDFGWGTTPHSACVCTLSWCVKTMQSTYAEEGYFENVTKINVLHVLEPSHEPRTNALYEQDSSSDSKETRQREDITVLGDSGFHYKVAFETHIQTSATINEVLASSKTVEEDNDSSHVIFTTKVNNTQLLDELAMAMTMQIRSAVSDTEMIEGQAYVRKSVVEVQWSLLNPLISLLCLSYVYLVKAIISGQEVLGVWKTSELASLLHGLPHGLQHKILGSKDAKTTPVESQPISLKVKMSPTKGWRVSSSKPSPVSRISNHLYDDVDNSHRADQSREWESENEVASVPQILCTKTKRLTQLESSHGSMGNSANQNSIIIRLSAEMYAVANRVLHGFADLLIAIGYLEPPLAPGMVRLRWKCSCGERFTADAKEYAFGGASELETSARALIGNGVTVTRHSATSTNQRALYPRPRLWLQRVVSRLTTTFKSPPERSTLPQHNLSESAIDPQQRLPVQPPKLLHLLACMRHAQLGKTLHQDCIDTIDTDRKLFCFLRQIFNNKRGRFCALLSLKKVKGISFVKFNLFAGGSVEVRHHSYCCENVCECIPPQSRVEPSDQAEYRCKPAGPLKIGPPILPDILEHFFAKPSCLPEHSVSILNRLPKRTRGELQGSVEEPAEGWGIYYQEGLDGDMIALLVFALFLTGSLLFGVLWSCLKLDIQAAFSVSAYVMTASAISAPLVAMGADKL